MEADKEWDEQHSFLTVKVVTDGTFSRHEGFDLAVFGEGNQSLSDLPTFLVPRQETYTVFKSRVVRHSKYPKNRIRLWVLTGRQNKTIRPEARIPENEPPLSTL